MSVNDHHEPVRRRRSASVYIAWLMCLLPILSWAEMSLRPSTAVPFIRNFILEFFVLLFLSPLLFLLLYPFLIFVLLVVVLAVTFRQRKQKNETSFIRLFFGNCWRPVKFLGGALLAAFWWAMTAVGVGCFAIVGSIAFAVFLLLARKCPRLKNNFWLIVGFFGFFMFFMQLTQVPGKFPPAQAEHLYPYESYDAVALFEGDVLVLDAEVGRAVQLRDQQARIINETYRPQRAAFDRATGDVYITNFGAHRGRTVTRLVGNEKSFISWPTCNKAKGVAIDQQRHRLFVACEKSGTLYAYDLSTQRLLWEKDTPLLPYEVAVDSQRQRLFVTNEVFLAKVTVFDSETGRQLAAKRLGWLNWGIAVDETTGLAWVARPIVGEVVAVDGEGRVVKRISFMNSLRDLAIDQEHGLMLVGHYFYGLVSVVDLRKGELETIFSIGEEFAWPMLRGVEVAPDSSWIFSLLDGVWRVKPRFAEDGSFLGF